MTVFRNIAAALSALALLVGCQSAPATYEPADAPGESGFSQEEISPVRTRITFAGNEDTPRKTVEDFLLYRAAEVAREKGYETFTLAGHGDTEARIFVTDRSVICDYSPADFSAFTYYAEGFGWARGGDERDVRYRAHVYLSPGNAEADTPGATTWKTDAVLANMKACVTGTGEPWTALEPQP